MIHITAAATNQTPICLIRFSAFRSPLWSFLVHTPGTIAIRSPVKSNTIRINNIFYSLYLISQNFRLQCTSEKSEIFRTDGHSPYHMRAKQQSVCEQPFFVLPSCGTAHCLRTLYHLNHMGKRNEKKESKII